MKINCVSELILVRNYIGKCIDGEQEFDIHELWEWLDRLVGEEE